MRQTWQCAFTTGDEWTAKGFKSFTEIDSSNCIRVITKQRDIDSHEENLSNGTNCLFSGWSDWTELEMCILLNLTPDFCHLSSLLLCIFWLFPYYWYFLLTIILESLFWDFCLSSSETNSAPLESYLKEARSFILVDLNAVLLKPIHGNWPSWPSSLTFHFYELLVIPRLTRK